MAYIGQRPVIGRYIKLDQISSGFNGSNTGFSMTAGSQAVFPGTARNLLLSLGGVIQEPDTDFTISGSTLTFTTPPVANTTFFGVIYGDMQATGTPSDGTVLPASIASSGHFKIPQLTVNEDGADVDFRVEGDTEANLLFVDAGEDKVGIGTGTPSGARLHIVGSGNTGIKVQVGSSSADQIYLGNTGGASSVGTLTNVGFNLIQNGGVALAVDTSKNVGIGTTSPSSKLSVVEAASTNSAHIKMGTSTNQNTHLELENDGSADIRFGCFGSSATTFGNITANNGFIHTTNDLSINAASSTGNVKIGTGATPSTKLFVKNDGNVGIGTTAPESNFHIHVSSASTGPILRFTNPNGGDGTYLGRIQCGDTAGTFYTGVNFFKHDTNDGEIRFRMKVDGTNTDVLTLVDGRAGIGTTSPDTNLVVSSNDHTGITIESARTTATDNIGSLQFQSGSTDVALIQTLVNGTIKFRNTSSLTDRVHIDHNGTLLSFSTNDTTPNIKWRSDDTNWFGSLNQSVEGATISTFLSTGGDWSANGTTYSATKAIASFETRAIVLHPQFNNGAGKVAFLQKAAGSTTTDGTVTEILSIDNAGIKFGASGAGIDFSATSDASGKTSELLDDYEEGNWTPVYVSSNSTISYTTQQGFYTKVGNKVVVTAFIRTSSVSSTSHSLVKVSGLPFAEAKGQRTPGSVRCNGFQGTATDFGYPVTWSVEANQSHGELQRYQSGGNGDFTTSTMNNATFVYLQCTYHTAS